MYPYKSISFQPKWVAQIRNTLLDPPLQVHLNFPLICYKLDIVHVKRTPTYDPYLNN